jgi:serine protease Do
MSTPLFSVAQNGFLIKIAFYRFQRCRHNAYLAILAIFAAFCIQQTFGDIMKTSINLPIAILMTAILLSATPVPECVATTQELSQETQALRQTSKAFAAVARQAMPAVVFIRVEKTVTQPAGLPHGLDPNELLEQLFGIRQRQMPAPEQRLRQTGTGTGFIVTKDGYILTNNHIVGDADRITVRTHDGREFQAELVGSDPRSEVALVKIAGDDFPVLPIGDSDAIEIGEWVIAIGNPFGFSETLTVGVVSAKGRNNIGITDYEDFIQTDAAINPGNSGGPLLNIEGKVIGINTAIFSQMGGSLGIGFSIPINMAMKIKEQLMTSGTITRGFLGVIIQELTPELAEQFKCPQSRGVLISGVSKGSAAEEGGIHIGDIILETNGKSVDGTGAFRNMIAMTAPGTVINLTIWRDEKRSELKVKVGSQEGGEGTPLSPTAISEKIGLAVEDLTPQWAQRFGYTENGVLVTRVRPDSPAAQAGIQPGHLITAVNHREVCTAEEFNAALAQSAQSGMLLVLVRDQQSSRFVVIPLK